MAGAGSRKRQDGEFFYTDVATYATGNILSLLLIFIIYQINTVLSDFRDPMVYALLSSTALRYPKKKLTDKIVSLASGDGMLLFLPFRMIFIKPYEIILGAWSELRIMINGFGKDVEKAQQSEPSASLFKIYMIAGVRAFTYTRKKKLNNKSDNGKVSSRLLWILIKLSFMLAIFEWIRDTWSPSSQVAFLSFLVILLAGAAMISSIQYFSVWHSSVNEPFSPRTPHRTRSRRLTKDQAASPEKHQWPIEDTIERQSSWYERVCVSVMTPLNALDACLKTVVQSGVHSLVSATLILSLVLGTAVSATFIGYQIVSEGRDAVILLKDTLADPWNLSLMDRLEHSSNSTEFSKSKLWSNVPWLSTYKEQMSGFIEDYLPHIFEWVEEKTDYIFEANNLTSAAIEGRYLMESLRGPRKCSEGEKNKILVDLARTRYDQKVNRDQELKSAANVSAAEEEFQEILKEFSRQIGQLDESDSETNEQSLLYAQHRVREAQNEHSRVVSEYAKSARLVLVTERRLALCRDNITRDADISSSEGNHNSLLHEIGTVIRRGFRKIANEWDFQAGLADTWNGLHDVWDGFTSTNQTGDQNKNSTRQGIIHFDSLQSISTAAIGPLVSVVKALFVSFESTTSAAIAGSATLVRIGATLFQFGMQSLLFLSLLFALLSAEEDPLARMMQLFPLPQDARDKASDALNQMLGGVFSALIKLAVIHGLFTWVTFKIFGAPLVYLSSTVSAAFSLLPLIPSYMICIPALIALSVQGRIVSGVILFALHFAAASFGDSEVLNEAGGEPYLMSLSVLGGMYAFYPNPFLGCILGPILLSSLYALGAIHSELMTGGRSTRLKKVHLPTTP